MEQLSENTASENFSIIRRLKDNYPSKVVIASTNKSIYVYSIKWTPDSEE